MMKKRELIRNTCLAGVGFLATNTLGFEGQLPSWTNVEIKGENLFNNCAIFGTNPGDCVNILGVKSLPFVKKIVSDQGKLGAVSYDYSLKYPSFDSFGAGIPQSRECNLTIKFEYNKHLNYLDYLNFIKKEGFNVKIYHSKE